MIYTGYDTISHQGLGQDSGPQGISYSKNIGGVKVFMALLLAGD
ncbi:hypothetical protein SDC9_132164 [bioreactor metagenome]|uniref:Uncharacterized protein n=1 Tax=bioreactor metagenome TaxID=1076179 RepID=A0A645D7C4_9ZZZZ